MSAGLQFPYDDEVLAYYDLLQTGKAWNRDCVDVSKTFTKGMSDLGDLIGSFGVPELAQHANQLDYYATAQASALTDHLNWHFDNLPTNLSLMSGYIGDLAALTRLPGYNDGSSYSSGGYVGLSGVSARAMMLGAPAILMMADTGSGSGGGSGSSGGGQCDSMGAAFGSIMGKASQMLGSAQGMLGQVQGLMGGLMGGGVLGAISNLGNVAGLAGVPGIGQLGSLMSGAGNLANLGQIGTLISNVGQFGNVGALGSTLTGLLGGQGNALGNLMRLGSTISSMAGYATQASGIGGVPVLASYSPYAVQGQLGTLQTQLSTYTSPATTAQLRALASALSLLLLNNPSQSTDTVTMIAQTTAAGGNIATLIANLNGLADYLDVPGNIQTCPNQAPTIALLQNFYTAIQQCVQPSAAVTALLANIQATIAVLQPLQAANMTGLTAQMSSLSTALGNYGGTTGFGNVGSIIGQAQSVIGGLGSLAAVPGIGSAFSGLTSLIPNMQSLTGAFGAITSGNLMGVMGGLSGVAGNMGGILSSLGAGNIGSLLGNLPGGLGGITSQLGSLIGGGGLGGIMNGITSMIGGEKGLIGAASGALTAIAGSFNLKALKNNACASSVLGGVGSDALQSAGGGTPSGGENPAGTTAADSLDSVPDSQIDYSGSRDTTPNQVYDDLDSRLDPDTPITGDPTSSIPGSGSSETPGPAQSPSQAAGQGTASGALQGDGITARPPTFTLADQYLGGVNSNLNQQYLNQTPQLSGGDDNPPTAAQIAALNQTTDADIVASIGGNDETPPTAAQIRALNEQAEAAERLTPQVTPQSQTNGLPKGPLMSGIYD